MKTLFRKKRKPPSGDMALQITSMADIFTIILVFLLKSTASGESTVSPSGDMTLPILVTAGGDVRETVKVEITQDSVMVDQKIVAQLRGFQFGLGASANSAEFAESVRRALAGQRKIAPTPNMSSDLLILADERVPYSTLKRVLAAAGSSGFVDLQLVAVKEE